MKVVAVQNNTEYKNNMIIEREPTLVVEMTQEEYQKCCVALYKDNEPQEENILKGML